MKPKAIYLTCLLCGLVAFVFGQTDEVPLPCSSDEDNKAYYLTDPVEAKAQILFNQKAKALEKSGAYLKSAAKYTIPVVFHIYGKTQSGKSITYEKIKRAVEVINEDFNGRNPDYNLVDSYFKNRRGTLNIEFALAKIDPNGGSTNGVIFHPYIEKGFGNGSGYNDKIASYAWDNYKYMNVYIMNDLKDDGKLTRSGVAWFPNTSMSNKGLARVLYNGRYLHGNTNTEFASILSHEFGHWLNLYHTFNGDGCDDPNGDYVSDTPQEDTNSTNRGCEVGASECGNRINYENYMGYESSGGCARMFTKGQISRMSTALDHATRRPLWRSSNLEATGVNLSKGMLIPDDYVVEESAVNNGTLGDVTYFVDLDGATFALSSGAMTEGTHFTTNLPQGVTVKITVESNKKLRVKFGGKASNHSSSDDKAGVITFRNGAIAGGTSKLNVNKIAYDFKFYDPNKVVYKNIPDEVATSDDTWHPFRIKAGVTNNRYGVFYKDGDLLLETYTKAIVSESGTRNATYLKKDRLISDKSNWVKGGKFPDLHVVENSDYRTWRGRTGYIGFQLEVYPGKTSYGWMRVKVNSSGTELSVLEYAYNTTPNAPIKAGSRVSDPVDPSCDDGIQNGDETGVDCGGSCEPCQTDDTYCEDKSTRTSGEYISKVELGSIDNSTKRSANGYGDYTSISTDLVKESSNTITITPDWGGSGPYSEAYGVWIDYNQDGDFTDPGEKVFEQTPTKDTSVSGSFSIPASAKIGETRMRIIMEYFNDSTSLPEICKTNHNYGETEDYTVNITGAGATCDDGIQNGDETGIDCGGSCDPCQTNQVYCAATGDNGPEGIVNVAFAGINKTSTRSALGYEDFTSVSANVNVGSSYDLKVTIEGYKEGENDDIYAWIDWNQNGDFSDSGEFYNLKKTSGLVGDVSINVPQDAKNGATRMRVLVSYYNDEKNPCDTGSNDVRYGEYEDYTVVVAGGSKSLVKDLKISTYPNPFENNLVIDVSQLDGDFTIGLYNLLGKRVKYQKGAKKSANITMDVEDLAPGNYFIKVTSKKHTKIVKLIKAN